MQNIHPILVHFTIALFTTSVVFDIIGYLTKRESLKSAGWWNLLFATIAAVPTIITGLLAESSLPHTDEAHRLMEIHETLGFIVLGTMVILLVWRSLNRGSLPARLTGIFLLLGVIGVGVITTGGYYGGEMVYTHGMGVAPMMESMMAGHNHSAHEHNTGENHHVDTIEKETYSCPMHPEVISNESGKCSICGMKLQRVSAEDHHGAEPAGEEHPDKKEKSQSATGGHGDHDHGDHQH